MAKPKVYWEDDKDFVYESLGITKERMDELEYRMSLIIHDFLRPTKSGVLPSTGVIIKLFVQLAENAQELILCAYFAGQRINEMFGEQEIEDEYRGEGE